MGESSYNEKSGGRLVGLIFGGCVSLGLGVGFLFRPCVKGILAGVFIGAGLGFIFLGRIWLRYGKW